MLSPMTNRVLTSLALTPNHALRKLIDDFISGNTGKKKSAVTAGGLSPIAGESPREQRALRRRAAESSAVPGLAAAAAAAGPTPPQRGSKRKAKSPIKKEASLDSTTPGCGTGKRRSRSSSGKK